MKTTTWTSGNANASFDDWSLQARYRERKSQVVIAIVVITLLVLGSTMLSFMMH